MGLPAGAGRSRACCASDSSLSSLSNFCNARGLSIGVRCVVVQGVAGSLQSCLQTWGSQACWASSRSLTLTIWHLVDWAVSSVLRGHG